jgi:hypothetical protein
MSAPRRESVRVYLMILRMNICTHGEELVDEAVEALMSRHLKWCMAFLRWRCGGASATERKQSKEQTENEQGRRLCGPEALVDTPI